jgi:Tfp pilus assembly protein PilO
VLSNPLKSIRPTPSLIHATGMAITIVAGLAFYFGFYVPASADMRERTARMEQLDMLLTSSERVSREHRALQERLKALQTAVNQTRQRMPRRHSTQEFIESITQLAISNGLEVELCSAAAPESFKTHTRVAVTCRILGSFASVCRFLADVDQLTQISRVSSFAIDSAENSEAYPVQVIFQLYYRAEVNDTELRRGTP